MSVGKRVILALVKTKYIHISASSKYKQFLIFPIEIENDMFIKLMMVYYAPEAIIICSSKEAATGIAAAIGLVSN